MAVFIFILYKCIFFYFFDDCDVKDKIAIKIFGPWVYYLEHLNRYIYNFWCITCCICCVSCYTCQVLSVPCFDRLQQVLHMENLADILDSSLVVGRNILHNCVYVNKSGIVTNIPQKGKP